MKTIPDITDRTNAKKHTYQLMKKILFIALLPVVLVACEKEENTNEQFQLPTCADSTDEGIFEKFTTAEKEELLKFHISVPETEDGSAIAFTHMTSRILHNESVIYDPVFQYKQLKPTHALLYLPYKTGTYYSWNHISDNLTDTLEFSIYNVRHLQLTPGCYRLYYVFADLPIVTDTSTSYGTVFTKGHYDIEIK